jgi:acetyltransferase
MAHSSAGKWQRHCQIENLKVLIRPLKANDQKLVQDLFAHLNANDLRLRFFAPLKQIPPALMRMLIDLDYSRAMAFVAIDKSNGHTLGIVRLHGDTKSERAEFAIAVRSDIKGHGLGWLLMNLAIEYARSTGLKGLFGQILSENTNMLQMCKELGFSVRTSLQDLSMYDASIDFEVAVPRLIGK